MKNFTDTLRTIAKNLTLVTNCYAKHPGLFEWEDYIALENETGPPVVTVWGWTGDKPAQMRAAAVVPEGNWRRVRLANRTYVWRGNVMGVEFLWEEMENPEEVTPSEQPIDFAALNLAPPEGQDSPQAQQQADAPGSTAAGGATPGEAA
jgi:hypothetical protein